MITQIKLGSVAFSVTFLQSFASEKEWLHATMKEYYPELDEKTRRATLREVYKIFKGLK